MPRGRAARRGGLVALKRRYAERCSLSMRLSGLSGLVGLVLLRRLVFTVKGFGTRIAVDADARYRRRRVNLT